MYPAYARGIAISSRVTVGRIQNGTCAPATVIPDRRVTQTLASMIRTPIHLRSAVSLASDSCLFSERVQKSARGPATFNARAGILGMYQWATANQRYPDSEGEACRNVLTKPRPFGDLP